MSQIFKIWKATTVIYDKDGNQAGSLSGQKGTYVELDAISDNLEKCCCIATEDGLSTKIVVSMFNVSSWRLCLWDTLVVVQPLRNNY